MKIAVVITTYNRPQYLKRCLDSVKRSNLCGAEVNIYDDCSNEETKRMLYEGEYNAVSFQTNRGICSTLLCGLATEFNAGADIVINLDSDAIVRNDWIERLLELHYQFPDKIITGFHSTTKNADGTERHKMIRGGTFNAKQIVNIGFRPTGEKDTVFCDVDYKEVPVGWCEKESVGGINMLFTRETFEKYAKPALERCLNGGNWDHQTCIAAGSVICAIPSLIQHIGIESSLGHTHDKPDVADDFKTLSLPNVTLVCVDDNIVQASAALNKCTDHILFGDIFYAQKEYLGSKEAYSKYILTELYKHIITDFVLIVQHDGYVKNPEAWTNEFLNYDYIGAPWWYKDGMNVGNGGFSLRSKKLMQYVAENIPAIHPEDHTICRTYRKQIEAAGFKFAPEEIASKFSFEGHMQTGSYTNQFGFHGHRAFRRPPDPKKQGFIINQFLGLGDILFLVPLVRKWMSLGHDVIWPVADEYFNLKDYFTDIQFVPKSKFKMLYDHRTDFMHRFQWGIYQVKSLRWNLAKVPQDAMTTKYTMYGEDYNMWRELRWERNYVKEAKLANLLGARGEYLLMCSEFGNITDGGTHFKNLIYPQDKKLLPYVIELKRIEGYTLLDWAGVIENATEIHAVSSSTFYLFEVLNLKCKEVHLYSRKLGKLDFDYLERLMTKNYKLHL